MKSDEKIIPDYIIELIQQCIERVEGEIYPRESIDMVPWMLRKVIKSLERRNSPEYIKELRDEFIPDN